jgi:hypothetical protein
MKNQVPTCHSFRFEMNATIVLSHLTRKNEEPSYNVSSFSFWDERDYPSITFYANEWRTKLQRFIVFVSKWTRLHLHQYQREWMKNEATIFYLFRFEMNATILRSDQTPINEEPGYNGSIFSFEINSTILLSQLTRMNEEWCFNVSSFSFGDERYSPSITSNEIEWRMKV